MSILSFNMFQAMVSFAAMGILFALSIFSLVRKKTIADSILSLTLILLAVMEYFDVRSMLFSGNPLADKRVVLYLKSFLPAVFLLYGYTFSMKRISKLRFLPWLFTFIVTCLFLLCVFLFPINRFYSLVDIRPSGVLLLGDVGYWFYIAMMVCFIVALMNLEATFSSSSGVARWKIKYEFMGMASLIAVQIFYFSQGLLYRSVNMNLMPVKSGVFIIGGTLIAYSKIFRGGGVRIEVSRYMLYRSLTLLAVGFYLVALGLVGSGLRYLGMTFSREITVFLAFLFGIATLMVLFSEHLRRRAKVFINKHFYAHKHDYREQWMRFSGRLASCRTLEEVKEAIIVTFNRAFGEVGTILYLHDKKSDKYKLVAMEGENDAPLEIIISTGLKRYFVNRGRIFNARDEEYQPQPEEEEFIRRSNTRLVVPLIAGGRIEGVVVLRLQLMDEVLNYEDYDLMKTLGKQAASSLLNFRLAEELAEARELAAVAKVSSFVIHDLKNLASTLSLILDNAAGLIGDPEFQKDMMSSIRGTASKMHALIQKLRGFPEKQTLNKENIDLGILLIETAKEIEDTRPYMRIMYEGLPAPAKVDVAEMKKVVWNLILNALDSVSNSGGKVRVISGRDNGLVYFRVEDEGCGMSEYFIKNHLFKPFRTTKDKGLGIGLYQCKQIVDAHGGCIDVNSVVGSGSTFTVYLPAAGKDIDSKNNVKKVDI